MNNDQALRLRWLVACAVAATLGASMVYVSPAPGPPRLIADAILLGALQAIALGKAAKPLMWIGATIAAIGLGLVAGVVVIVGIVAIAGRLAQPSNADIYGALLYVLAAAAAGVVAGAVQAPLIRGLQRIAPWLLGNAFGAPFAFPALALSWFGPENTRSDLPLWLVGLVGGVIYGLVSGAGLTRSLSRR